MPSIYFDRTVGRRSVLTALGGLGVLGATGYTGYTTARPREQSGTSTPRDWPSFMHTAENTGFNPHASLAGPNLTQRWTFGPKENTANDEESNGFGPPVYANDTVYVGGYERLWALDPADGSERWRYNPDQSRSSDGDVTALGVTGDTVYVGTDHGRVEAVTADGRTLRWSRQVGTSGDTGGDSEGEAVRIRGMTAADGYVLAMEDGTADEPAVLHTLDAGNGAELWQREEGREDQDNPIQPAPPALHDGVVYDTANGLVALEAKTGKVKWGPRRPETNDPPAYSDGTIYVSGGTGGNAYYAVKAETGKTEWQVPFSGDPNVGARLSVVDDRRVYAGHATGDLNRLVAFDREDGEKLWTNEDDDDAEGGRGGFSVDAAVLYANETGGTALVALDPTDGTKLWAYKGMDRGTVPALVGSSAYFGGPKVVAIGSESTPTPTPTDRGTPTGTGTRTEPVTPTPTETVTETRTQSGTPTATDTATDRGTPTATDTPGGTDTPTEIFGPTGSPTPTDRTTPGLGILGTVGGLLGIAGYLRYRSEDEH